MLNPRSGLRLALLVLVAILALAGVTGVAASPPTSASGTFTYTSCVPTSIRGDGGNTTIDLTCTIAYTGTFSGSSVTQGPLIIHADGSTNYHGTETFTGTVNGAAGTVTFKVAAPGTATSFQGTNAVVSATGDLASLNGRLNTFGTVLPPPEVPFGTYTGQILFDP